MKLPLRIFLLMFIATVLVHNLRVPVTYLYYFLDTEDFVERLCENKDTPELGCNGKCYLMKMLKQNSMEEEGFNREFLSWPEKLTFILDPGIEETHEYYAEEKGYTHYLNNYFYEGTSIYFHPPDA